MTLIKKTFEDFSITEKRLKPITKKHWKKASDDQKEEWLLQAFSDPDDAEEFIEVDWEDLPDVATQNMYENFVDYYLTLNEGKVSKKHIDKKIDEISNLTKELKANFVKYKSAKTEDEKKEFMTIAADLTKKKHAADAELERLIQSFGKDMGLDPNFESVNEGILTTAAGVALGLVGAIALIKVASAAKNIVGVLALDAADKIGARQAAKRAAKRKADLEKIVIPIVKKFEDDAQLKKMYDELIPYEGGVSIKANKSNKKRSKQLQEIAKYIKSKLTPEEELYFVNVSKYLRDGVVESVEEASKLSAKAFGKWKQEREYVKQMADNNTSTVYKIADYVQFLGLMTQKQWEMFMYGRYEKHLQSKDPKVKNKIYKVLTKWFE